MNATTIKNRQTAKTPQGVIDFKLLVFDVEIVVVCPLILLLRIYVHVYFKMHGKI